MKFLLEWLANIFLSAATICVLMIFVTVLLTILWVATRFDGGMAWLVGGGLLLLLISLVETIWERIRE